MNHSIAPKTHRVPKPFAAIVDAVNARDREFFESNPDETCYLRPYVPGEYPPASLAAIGADMPDQNSWILVSNIGPGMRSRQPIGQMLHGDPPNGSRIALWVLSERSIFEDVPVVGRESGR